MLHALIFDLLWGGAQEPPVSQTGTKLVRNCDLDLKLRMKCEGTRNEMEAFPVSFIKFFPFLLFYIYTPKIELFHMF